MTTIIPHDTITSSSRSESVVRTCCFCFPLRAGCFILGYLNLISSAFSVLSILVFTLDFRTTYRSPQMSEKYLSNNEIGYLILRLGGNILWLLICVAFVVGLHKKQPGSIKAYVRFACFRLVLFCVLLFLAITAYGYTNGLIIYCIDIGLNAYFIFVYHTYTKQLEKELINARTIKAESPSGIEKGP